MRVFLESVLTFLTVFGLLMLLLVLFGRMVRPSAGKGMCVVLIGRGCGEELEGRLRGLIWLRSLGLLSCPVVIVDAGLNQEGSELAGRITRQWNQVYWCPLEELGENLSCLKET